MSLRTPRASEPSQAMVASSSRSGLVAAPSAEYQIVRRESERSALRVRVEFDPRRTAEVEALRRAIVGRLRERYDVASEIDLVARGELPRFAYKAARVVDE